MTCRSDKRPLLASAHRGMLHIQLMLSRARTDPAGNLGGERTPVRWKDENMPAVTVDNILLLPRIAEPGEAARERPVLAVTTAPSALEGEGFPVRRAFAGVDLRALDP